MKCALLFLITACVATEAQRREQRLACKFKPGALPSETIGADMPLGDKMPIEHVVLIMQENRSFDHYFSELPGVRTAPAGGDRVKATAYCTDDVPHNWNAVHKAYNHGAMDKWEEAAGGKDPKRALRYYGESDLPYYYALAKTFATSDMHFAALLGPTWPNRMFFMGGTAWGVVSNVPPPTRASDGTPYYNLFDKMADAGVDFRMYVSDAPTILLFTDSYARYSSRLRTIQNWYDDLAANDLPQFAMVEANYLGFPRNDEHAPNNIQRGQQFVASVLNPLMQSPSWKTTAAFVTWDEHGGFSDSVPPPPACDTGETLLTPEATPASFDTYGFRVGLLAVSPYVKRGHISHQITSHTSLLRFVAAKFNLPALTVRDANSDPLSDLFDFAHPNFDVPTLPEAVVDPIKDAECNALYERR